MLLHHVMAERIILVQWELGGRGGKGEAKVVFQDADGNERRDTV